ncbi:ATP-binding protein [Ramlibacter humi]|uniref:histidine kinase n=1 Tax=Ramlibacter humi TaxID=2530451 RepID=A0A4Z0C9D7_9BURK|nr:ATP-binding protein [Ramlibacter humi]TFZ07941.1 GAF domain-containing protein [Ramlibacter humi]
MNAIPHTTALPPALDPLLSPRGQDDASRAVAALQAQLATSGELQARTRELEATVATLQATLEATREGILVTDEDGRVTMANRRFEALWALTLPATGLERGALLAELAPLLAGDASQLLSCVDGADACLHLADGRVIEQRSRPQRLRGEAAGRVWTFLDVTQQHRAESELREEARALELVNRTKLQVVRELDPQRLLQSIAAACLQVGGAEYAAYFELETDSARVLAYAGPPLPHLRMDARIPPTRLFRATLERRRTIRIADLMARSAAQEAAPHPVMRSYLAVPVIARDGSVAGALMLGHSRAGMFGERAQRLASGLAAGAAVALDNARLLGEARQLAQERLGLLDRERAARQAVEQLNATLEQRVARRTQALSIANRDLEAFAFSVSHDLRSPLGRVDGYAQALAALLEDEKREKPRHYLQRIRANIATMGVMVESSLALAKLSFAPMRTELVDLSAIATRICRDLADAEPLRDCQVAIEPGLRVQGDAALLDVMLGNLLRNAWKFTAPRRPAKIAFRRVTGESPFTFEIADNGVGFDGEASERLFVPFQRFHADNEFPGTGIGLATVRRLVERHGGRISAHSSPGEGCRFEFTLGA